MSRGFFRMGGRPGLADLIRRRAMRRRNRLAPERPRPLEDRLLLAAGADAYGQLPLSFELNAGQAAGQVEFLSRGEGYTLTLASGDARLQLQRSADPATGGTPSRDVVDMRLVGANERPAVAGIDPLPGRVNYFLGADPSQWRTNIPTFAKVSYQDVYPGIDLVYYGNQRQLEYDFVVGPGADPGRVLLSYDGATSMAVDADGNLVLGTDGGKVVLHRPVLYQDVDGRRREVSGAFAPAGGNHVGFSVGAYDRSKPLVIDPILVYSTYFGGTGDDQALAVAVDGQGGAYFTGSTLSTDLATTPGAVAPGSFISDLFKSSNQGASWQGSGNGLPDADFSEVLVDPKDANTVYAATFRDRQTAQGLFKSTDGGRSWASINAGLTSLSVGDIAIDPVDTSTLYASAGGFLFKTTDGGAHWAPLTGGLPNDGISYNGIAVAPSDPRVVYVVHGRVQVYRSTDGGASFAKVGPVRRLIEDLVVDPSNANTLFYGITKGAFFDDPPGGVYKSTDGGQTITATGLTVSSGQFSVLNLIMAPGDPNTLYVATGRSIQKTTDGGAHWASITPGLVTNGNINQIALGGGSPSTIYVATNFQGLLKSTDGGSSYASANLAVGYVSQVATDPSNPGVVYATTSGRPRTPVGASATDAFVAKLTPDGKAFAYITYLGGVGNDVGRGIGVDAGGNAVVGGITTAGAFPTTPGAFQETTSRPVGGSLGFVTKLNANGSGLIYSTYLGGSNSIFASVGDEVHALAVAPQGRAVVTGQTSSPTFPTTPNAYAPALFGSSGNAFVTQLSADGKDLVYSSFLGGQGDIDSGEAIALDAQGNFYVAGTTSNAFSGTGTPGTNFPTTPGAYQSSKPTTPIGFFSKIDPTAGANGLVYSTILGGSSQTFPRGIAVDGRGFAYVVGNTFSADFPTTPSALQSSYRGDDTNPATGAPVGDGFLAVYDPTKSGNASLVYGTYLGGAKQDIAHAVALEGDGRAVVTGSTTSPTFPSKDAISAFPGGQAAFVARLDVSRSGAASLVGGTFLGGSGDKAEGRALAIDLRGNIYVAGSTSAADFATIGPAQGAYRGGSDAFVARLSPDDGRADLRVTVTADPDPVTQGDNVVYTITVTNTGPDAVDGVYVSDKLDVGTVFISADRAPSSIGAGAVGFALGSLAAGASTQIRLTIRVDTPSFTTGTGTGQSLNTAVVSGDRPDPNPSDNQYVYTATVNQRTADLALVVTTVPGPILTGEPFVYRLVVTNNGPDDAQNVVLTENLPTGASFVFATPAPTTNAANVLTFNLGTIAAGESRVVLLHMTPIASPGSFVFNTASVSTPSLDTNASNNSSSLETVVATRDQADLGVAIAGPQFSVAFDGLTYTVTVRNDGPHAANHVFFTGEVTALATIVSIAASQGTAAQSGNIITADLGTIAPDSFATVTFVVNAPTSDTSITVKASADADETDPNPINDKAKLRTKVGEGAITFVVTNTNDSGPGSLRQALEDSESQGSTVEVPNHIVFAIPETDPGLSAFSHAFIIQPRSPLPAIFTPTVVDGYTQPGSSPNTNPIDRADNAKIRIEIDCSQAGLPNNGFTVYASNSVFRGLAINNAITKLQRGTTTNLLLNGAGIFILGNRVTVEGCFIGTDATGTIARGNEVLGIAIFGSFNTIGGTAAAARNVISGNGASGTATASSVGRNVIIGNFIGTDVTGARALPTNLLTVAGLRLGSEGIGLDGIGDRVGGTTPEERNVISGNPTSGVGLRRARNSTSTSSAYQNLIIGNFIGTDLTGTRAVPNGSHGVFNEGGIDNTIGGTTAAERNIISGNRSYGVELSDSGNVVRGNYVGTDVSGLRPLGNGLGGIDITGSNMTVGGTAAGAGNVISGNNGPGIRVTGNNNSLAGNAIGLDAAGNPLGNNGDGVSIRGTTSGTSTTGMGNAVGGNTIAFNARAGVTVVSLVTTSGGGTGNSVSGNSIFDNGGLGIDLGQGGVPDGSGVTPNHEPLVTSSGGNHFQNHPVLTSAISADGSTTILGTLAGLANRDYTIHFYASPYLDPTGFGEGKTYLGSANAHTDANGLASVSGSFPQALGGLYITATATTGNPQANAPGADTSEFSRGILVTGPGPGPSTAPSLAADLEIAAAVLTAGPVVGGLLTYRFTVTNRGPNPASTVVLSHALPVGFTLESADSTRGAATLNGNALTANLGTLAPDESATITIVVTPTIEGYVSGSATVTGRVDDPDAGNDTAGFDATIGPGSLGTDLAVSIVAAPDPVPLGSQLLYTITIANNGPRVATGIVFRDTLPEGVSLLTANNESTPGLIVNGRDLSISVGALAPGDFIRVFVAVQPTVAGPITNTASATLAQDDTSPGNNSASLTTTVLKSPSVTVVTSSLASSDPGQEVTFTARVTSPTIGRPTGTIVFREGNAVLATRALDADGSATFRTSGLSAGVHTITAEYAGDATFQPSLAPVDQPVTGAPATSADLAIEIHASPDPVVVGSVLTYTITVRNNGPNAASNVTVIDDLPAGVAIGSPTSSRGSVTLTGGRVTATLGTLAGGESATVTIPITPSAAATLSNAASVSATETDPNSNNNSASAQAAVVAADSPNADLSVTVAADPSPVAQGRNVIYTVVVRNSGPNTATSVTLTDTLPAGATFVSASAGTASNGVLTASLGDLPSGVSRTITIVVTTTSSGSLVNSATVASAGPADLNASNNSSSASVTSNSPITLNKTIDLIFGSIATPGASGYPTADAIALSAPAPIDVIDAILATPGLDPRVVAGLNALRGAARAKPSGLAFFTTTSDRPQGAFDGSLRNPGGVADASGLILDYYRDYLQAVTLGSGALEVGADTALIPLTLSFPNLTSADTGQVRDGVLTVRLVVRDARILGPIATSTQVVASPNPSRPGQDVVFVATVSGNGRVHPSGAGTVAASTVHVSAESGGRVTFFDGDQPLGAADLDAAGKAVLRTSTLSPGPHTITARYGGDDTFSPSASPAIVQLVGDLVGPKVVGFERQGFHNQPTSLILTFDDSLDAARAVDPANYLLVDRGRDGRFDTRDDRVIPLKSVYYDPILRAVTLRPTHLLSLWNRYCLTVRGASPGGISDEFGNLLDGKATGQAGSDYVKTIRRTDLVITARHRIPTARHAARRPARRPAR